MKNPILSTSNEACSVPNDLMNYTLRDHFAGLAMQSLINRYGIDETLYKTSFDIADMMLKERETKNTEL